MPGPPLEATPFDDLIPLEEQTPFDDLAPAQDLFPNKKPPNQTTDPLAAAKDTAEKFHNKNRLRQIIITNQLKKVLKSKGGYDEISTFGDNAYDTLKTADIGRSETQEMKRKKFMEAYPEGKILTIPTEYGPQVVARKNDSSPYRMLNPIAETIGSIDEGDIGAAVGSLAYSSSNPAVGAVATGGGAMVGEMTKDAIESYRGYGEHTSALDSVVSSLDDAALGAGTELGMRYLFRANPPGPYINESVETARGAARQGLLPLVRGQVSPYPLIQGLWTQVGKTSPVVKDTVTAQEQRFLGQLRSRADDRTLDAFSDNEIERITRAQYDELEKLNNWQSMNRPEAGTILTNGIDFFKRASKRLIDRRYRQAFKLGADDDIMWDLTPAKELARRIVRGTLARSTDPEKPLIQASQPLTGELRNVVETIMQMDSAVGKVSDGGIIDSGFQQLKELRSRLWDIKNGNDTFAAQKANELWETLTNVIDTPVNGNEAFQAAWRKASNAYAETTQILSRNYAKLALKENTAEQLARRYYQPGKAMELAELQYLLPAHQWNYFKQGFIADLMRDSSQAGGATARLNNWARTDPDGLRLLLNPAEERAVRKAAQMSDYIETGPMQKALARDREEGERVMHIVKNGTEKELAEIVRLAGGPNSPQAESMRAGVWQQLLDNATRASEDAFGADVINSSALVETVNNLKKSRKLRALFRPEDWQALEDYTRYAVVIGRQGDVGGGMQAGGQRSVLSQLGGHVVAGEFGKLWRGLIRPMFSNEISARILAKPRSANQLERRKNLSQNTPLLTLKAILDGAAQATKDLGMQSLLFELQEPEYLEDFAPAPPEPIAPPPQPAPAVPDRQGMNTPPPVQSGSRPQQMGSYLPPTPATQLPGPMPQQMPMTQPAANEGQKFAMLFPQDTLGKSIAQGGIASL